MSKRNGFLLGFLLVALVLAGAVSYLADSNPDGLDHATLAGCEVVETDAGEQLNGDCIAQSATEHELGTGPFADYAVGGDSALSGVAGVVGVVVTLVVAGGLFWVLRRRPAKE
ncbi:MAG: PDGLE domain-containing protein [Actinomycetota bacterium]|nr:PDGLE domain-containing protein [Actinomycetota bacterium]